jgi:NAD(P)-dependent dehydrogenase (short-subunit alcohol dehydrogenase family)
MNRLDFAGRNAIVTGGAQGIGAAIVHRLQQSGARVVVWDLDGSPKVDVADPTSVETATRKALAELGKVDVLVNNAGIAGKNVPTAEYPIEEWERVLRVNLTSQFLCCRALAPHMVKARYGRIVNIASVAGLVGSGGGAAYTASKHGVVGLTRQLAITYAGRGITVNAICPGAIQTALRDNSTRILGSDAPVMRGVGGDEAAIRAITPAGRRGTLEEIAAAACYLASSEADYVTGSTLVVDGGWTAR